MGFDFCSFVLFAYLSARRPADTFICTSVYRPPSSRSLPPRSIDRDIIAIIGALLRHAAYAKIWRTLFVGLYDQSNEQRSPYCMYFKIYLK